MKKIFLFLFLCTSIQIFSQQTFENNTLKLTKSITCTSIKDQAQSGTCWSFGSLSFLESEMIRNNIKVVDLSEMFIARHSYMYKIKEHLKQKGKNYFTPGGQFQDVVRVVKEFGIVPEQIYSGKKNISDFHNHSKLDTIIVHYVKELLDQKIVILSKEQEMYINKIFDQYLGKLPTHFIYKRKNYTPLTFAKKIVQLNMNDYISITSYNHHIMYSTVILEDKYNWSNSSYYNVPFVDFMQIAENAISNNYSIIWDGDVTEETFNYETGKATLLDSTQSLETKRNTSYKDSTSTIDHVMHIVGIANDIENDKWFYVKNSWGNTNNFNGYLYMSSNYFAIKTIAYIVHKNAIPINIKLKMKL